MNFEQRLNNFLSHEQAELVKLTERAKSLRAEITQKKDELKEVDAEMAHVNKVLPRYRKRFVLIHVIAYGF